MVKNASLTNAHMKSKPVPTPVPRLQDSAGRLVQECPLVSIGMPVFNGESFIEEAIRSLCDLNYPNTEIIVSDNASTDATQQICTSIIREDGRIRYYRNASNLGASRNFERVLELASGKYFMWAGAHDRWSPDFISRCVSVLEADDNCALAYSSAQWLDENGSPGGVIPARMNLQQPSAFRRILSGIWLFDYHAVYGVYRTSAVKRVSFNRGCLGPDWLLVLDLAGQGKVACIKDALLFMRQTSEFANWKVYFSKLQLPFRTFDCIRLTFGLYKNVHDICRRHTPGLWGFVASKLVYLEIVIRTGWLVGTIFVELCFPQARGIWLGIKRKLLAPRHWEIRFK